MAMDIVIKDNEYQCCLCGKWLNRNKFFKSSSPVYDGLGHLPICKDCIDREYKRFKIEYGDVYRAMQRICMLFDIYYDKKIVDACKGYASGNMVGNYLRKTNLGQYKSRTFDTTIEEGFVLADGKNEVEASKPVSQRAIDQWGAGLNPIDYDELDAHYKYLKSANPNCDSNQEIFINELNSIGSVHRNVFVKILTELLENPKALYATA